MDKNTKRIIYYAIIGALCSFCTSVGLKYVEGNRKNVTKEFSLYITPQTTYNELCDTIASKVKNIKSFKRCFKRENPHCFV